MRSGPLLAAMWVLSCVSWPAAAEPGAVTDPKQADADFAFQGEYGGEIQTDDGALKLGVQVIALGDGKFHLVAYKGGLPGDGWDKSDRIELDGVLQNGIAAFKGDHGAANIKDDVLTAINGEGKEAGTLKKVRRTSPTAGAKPPAGAAILFNGSSTEQFPGAKRDADGTLIGGITSQLAFQDCTLHLEFRTPYQAAARGQGRGNSGCYLQGRYEVQILDSFGLEGKNNECGGIYETRDPDLNMCFPPLAWQTYDIDYTAAKFDDAGKKTANARITVKLNGVTVHDNVEIPKATRGNPKPEGPEAGPLYLQDHGNPVRFRNIWLVAKK